MTVEFTLDGRCMTDRAAAHAHLQAQLHLPDYYGRNLDALYDLLTEDGTERTITVLYSDVMQQNLGGYAVALLETLYQASETNSALKIIVA